MSEHTCSCREDEATTLSRRGVLGAALGAGGAVRDNPEVNRMVAGTTALGRVGVPDDIGPAIARLLSEDNRWVNAQRIEISGGQGI